METGSTHITFFPGKSCLWYDFFISIFLRRQQALFSQFLFGDLILINIVDMKRNRAATRVNSFEVVLHRYQLGSRGDVISGCYENSRFVFAIRSGGKFLRSDAYRDTIRERILVCFQDNFTRPAITAE
jgi:hypothetical protein